jgi:hypothetical protein
MRMIDLKLIACIILLENIDEILFYFFLKNA